MYLLLIVGFLLLIKGADFFVEGSSSIAKILKVPSVVIGLTIVALGTSAPEAAVSITAGLSGKNDIALSNILGSNIFNTLVVIGVCAIIKPFVADKAIIKRDLPINIFVSLLVILFLIDGKINRFEGIGLLLVTVIYITILVLSAIKNRTEAEDDIKVKSPIVSIIYIVGGLAAIVFGGDLTVDNASKIAAEFGMSDTLIGLTIIAVGTSLPELMTSIVAARKGESGLALGNAIGSSILNIIFILGVSSVLSPITPEATAFMDAIIVFVVGTIIFVFSKTNDKITRMEGVLSVGAYIAYMVYAIMR